MNPGRPSTGRGRMTRVDITKDTRVKLTGVDEALAQLSRLAKEYPEAALRALNRQAEFTMTDSKFKYCPVKDGHLRASGHIWVLKQKLEVILGYGGPAGIGNRGETNREDVGYAVVQHETESYRHTVGESGFLRKPLQARLGMMGQEAAAEVRKDMKV